MNLDVLKDTVDKVDGAVSSMIIASGGIPIQEYVSEKIIDLTGLGAEASAMIRDIGFAAENLGIKPEGNYGKGRFVLKTTVPKIEGEF